MMSIGQILGVSFSISLSIVCVGITSISSISKVAISKMMSIGQILGVSFSLSLSIVCVRISSISSISKVAISKMMSIGQILRISISISLSIVGGVRISSISISISKVAISKMMSVGQILRISLWFSLSLSLSIVDIRMTLNCQVCSSCSKVSMVYWSHSSIPMGHQLTKSN